MDEDNSDFEIEFCDKYFHAPSHSINQYNRKNICKMFAANGSGQDICKEILQKYSKIDPVSVERFVNKHAKMAQDYVHEEASSPEFTSLEKWINYFKDHQYNVDCNYEVALVLKTIAQTEKFPKPESEDEIDFKKLYLWLADVMMGNAPAELNPQSQLFLVENFTNLLASVNKPECQKDVTSMSGMISERSMVVEISGGSDPTVNSFTKSINPLKLDIKKSTE